MLFTHNFSRILHVIVRTSTNLLLFANGVQFDSSSQSKVLHTEYMTIWWCFVLKSMFSRHDSIQELPGAPQHAPYPTAPSRVACLPKYFMYCNYLKRLGTRQLVWCYSECISTPARHIFQVCPVWIYTQSKNYQPKIVNKSRKGTSQAWNVYSYMALETMIWRFPGLGYM
jgi:hypothetical protein